MKPSQIISALNTCIDARIPAMLWGPAGAGKSDVVAQLVAHRKVELRDVRLANLDPTDIKGFPVPDTAKGIMRWLPADFMPAKGKGVLFFDELNLAEKMTQASCYQLMLTRQVGNYKLPAGWDIVAAGNREGDRGNVVRMAGPLANRLVHLDYEIDLAEWVAYAHKCGVVSDLIDFVRFRPELLHKFDAQAKDPAFPSPRTWFYVNRLLKESPVRDVQFELIKGTIGIGAGTELQGFLDHVAKLPRYEDIIANPTRVDVPLKVSAQHAAALMLARQVTPGDFPKAVAYVDRLSQEMGVLFMRDVGERLPALRTTSTYRDWTVKNHDVVIS